MSDIDEPPETPDYYANLCVSQTASKQQIRKAYLNLAKVTHPDKKGGNPDDAADFRQVNEAWEFLSDPVKRERYDRIYLDVQDAWYQYKQKKYERIRREERRAAKEKSRREREAAEAERIRKGEKQRRAAEEKARLEKLREKKMKQAEERSREVARRAWEERQRAARERILQEKAAEAERRSEEAAARMRIEQEKAAIERLKAYEIEERLSTARRKWKDMRQACEAYGQAEPRHSTPSQFKECAHPQFQWKKKGRANCSFCNVVRKKWSFLCPDCGASACPICMQQCCQ
ncbi:hypothetical protein GGS21DRAFT_490442 [Xylaria nigripes]|nr:hypothetical protein GGS21DRAFT_490442 [Xylaria nigripes]